MNFQNIILQLQQFWTARGCILLQPYDLEMGAGTFHPLATFKTLEEQNFSSIFVQPSRRPQDGRYGDNPNRAQYFYQLQVFLQPSPGNDRDLILESLQAAGIVTENHDMRFIEDNWESPVLGAAGLGWELRCDGMEAVQVTYFKQFAGMPYKKVPLEIAYGLSRIAMISQNKQSVDEVMWNDNTRYADIHTKDFEHQWCS